MDQELTAKKTLSREISVPGDKSISHRFLLLNALSKGSAAAGNMLLGLDCLSTLACLRDLGVNIAIDNNSVIVDGVGMRGFTKPDHMLDVGNSGTTMRIMPGILVGQDFCVEITGDESIRRRPMDRVITPLRMMNARISALTEGKYAPLRIEPTPVLRSIDYDTPVASAQVKSCVLLAGLYAEGETTVTEPGFSRDHTERMLRAMGAECSTNGNRISILPTSELEPLNMKIPSDISSAAYWMVAAVIMKDTVVEIGNVCVNPTRTGIIEALRLMGASISIAIEDVKGPEPIGTITAESSNLKGVEIAMPMIPTLIDEISILAIAASQAEGTTTIKDASELRVKEVDRISTLVLELRKMGVAIDDTEDGFVIHGPCRLKGTIVDSHGDHRLAMSLAIASLIAEGTTVIQNSEVAEISYPNFWNDLRHLSN